MRALAVLAILTAIPLVACGIDVRESESGDRRDVDIRTPVGGISVQTDGEAPDTGLPIYPGARLRRNSDDPASANVRVDLPFVDVKVAAATFEHDDAPDAIIDFYRDAMRTYGEVVECRGDADFRRRSRPVCNERRASRQFQLVVGTEDRHRLFTVKPRGSGSEFAVVYVQTSGDR